ncbi:HAD family hydrolase [Halalkalibacterium halodurans]|uniref:HAD family hydrolase n=1 Tax=Halalkalibacterium halodurans TaxID=86665 RepID=UPI002AA97C31|nr:HAD family hydrolase [Halalkalibacterium halodurans]MDY7223226.1 HAD family hydrolase [Halalkalibacterium halodurans]MDY7242447.1 HAD family hydrolase [Halalkalibacterium halodurans]
MGPYKVLFLDIDGTILLPDDTVQESTKVTIRHVQEQGMEVFLATGRPLHEISELAEQLKVHSFIGYNGAYAIYNGKDILMQPIEPKTLDRLLTISRERNHEVVMYTNEENVLTGIDTSCMQQFIRIFHLKHNRVYDPKKQDPVLGMTLLNVSREDVAAYEACNGIHLASVNVGDLKAHAYDVIRDTTNKGIAVQQTLSYLGIEKEEAVAFGDGMNDKEMLKYVGVGIAMGNAHPDLLAYADDQTTSVECDGVSNGLKKLGLVPRIL